MLAFAIRRLIQMAGVMLVVALISFLMFRFVGDPVNQLVGVDTRLEQRAELGEQLGLND
ncbi:ABC transporter permease, partial [Rhizobiaceae sp. 2RAB30]